MPVISYHFLLNVIIKPKIMTLTGRISYNQTIRCITKNIYQCSKEKCVVMDKIFFKSISRLQDQSEIRYAVNDIIKIVLLSVNQNIIHTFFILGVYEYFYERFERLFLFSIYDGSGSVLIYLPCSNNQNNINLFHSSGGFPNLTVILLN